MSMFGMVFPDPDRQMRVGILMGMVAHDQGPEDVEAYMESVLNLRIRDAWVERQPDGPPVMALYTRNGGGNREHDHTDGTEHCLGCRGEEATRHPRYLRDADDEFDSTYRTYWFAFPADLPTDHKEALNDVAEEPRDMSEIWLQAINSIGGEAASRG
jgi:hypothetical protein